MLPEKFSALFQPLGMGIDLFQIFYFRTGKTQQVLIHLDDLFPDDMTVILSHQVIHFRDASGGGVLNGQYAVFDFVILNCCHYILKMDKIHLHFGNVRKVVFQRLMAERTFHSLIPDTDRVGVLLFLFNIRRQYVNLQITAGLHNLFHNLFHMRGIGRIFQHSHHFGNDLLFSLPVQHLHITGIFIRGNLLHHIHPFFQRIGQDCVQPVDFLSQFC